MTGAATAMLAAAPARATSARKLTSPCGIEAWLVEDHTNPLVAMHFAFTGGSSQDPTGKPGVSHLLSGMLDEGAGPYQFRGLPREDRGYLRSTCISTPIAIISPVR